ncbi:MAG: hypothetical protein JO075_08505 [Acidimicrobiia bacterium]|nr:hypothetical protein [Acidimicrobiia bacterium]
MQEHTQGYLAAREIAIEAAELGQGPDDWAAWTDEISYAPTEAEAAEASQLFGELEDDLDVAEFVAWLEGLHQERFRAVTAAIDTLRSALIEYRSDVDVSDVAGWMV